MAEKKITKREMFEGIKATLVENFDADDVAAYVEFINKQIEYIDAKNEKEKEKRAEKKAQGDALSAAVAEAIRNADKPVTADEIVALVEANSDEEVTRNKVTYRASQLAKNGEAVAYSADPVDEDAE